MSNSELAIIERDVILVCRCVYVSATEKLKNGNPTEQLRPAVVAQVTFKTHSTTTTAAVAAGSGNDSLSLIKRVQLLKDETSRL